MVPAWRTGGEAVQAAAASAAKALAQAVGSSASGDGSVNSTWSWLLSRRLFSCCSAVSCGSSAVRPRSPQIVSCEIGTGSSVRGAMKASAAAVTLLAST